MARPFKSGVDYFPLDVVMDDKVELLEAEHGIGGFGIYIKLYQKVYANNYWINWDNKSVIVFSSRINVDINSVNAIINSCLEWDIFDKNLFNTYFVLTSRGIQKRFFEITKRRKEIEIINEYMLVDLPKNTETRWINVNINLVNASKSTQSKVKGKKKEETTNGFDLFYSAYPKKKSKGQAEKAFQKINPDQNMLEKIIKAIGIQEKGEGWVKENGKYIPHPATWLNAKGWDDEESTPKSRIITP